MLWSAVRAAVDEGQKNNSNCILRLVILIGELCLLSDKG